MNLLASVPQRGVELPTSFTETQISYQLLEGAAEVFKSPSTRDSTADAARGWNLTIETRLEPRR